MKCYTIEVVFFEDFTITVEVNIARAAIAKADGETP